MSTVRGRLAIAAALFIAMTAVLARASAEEAIPARQSFARFPSRIGVWTGTKAADFDRRVLDVLGVDDYIIRTLTDPNRRVLGLYVGYWGSQRQGDTIHSPLNCLPGSGWEPTSRRRIAIALPGGGTALINDLVIEKGLDREAVLYWYQSHGRIVASEYWGRAFLALDALRLNRTDGAMVRVIAPIGDSVDAARGVALDFAKSILPLLSRYLPD